MFQARNGPLPSTKVNLLKELGSQYALVDAGVPCSECLLFGGYDAIPDNNTRDLLLNLAEKDKTAFGVRGKCLIHFAQPDIEY